MRTQANVLHDRRTSRVMCAIFFGGMLALLAALVGYERIFHRRHLDFLWFQSDLDFWPQEYAWILWGLWCVCWWK